ncbi:FadR/GntR family transcriptional regulator [Bartonella choladocola]|uniref:DNA-binding transcriptional regulator, FadR family n=1 Tax=Bartonella choladocola TaxID=2750995 RepID=A0A1U9MFN4_9HYPH|nr:FadR/GntR family transcriptional regulator [Bartonella choladocola]AQT46520.1 DNA-binding transcriptional regulator, FadR family [Bartonella choladocola]
MTTPLIDGALDKLRTLLRDPAIKVGDRLPPETYLSRQIQVSRPVLRKALDILKAEGVLESRRGSGTYLREKATEETAFIDPPTTIADLVKCLQFRMIIEGGAARQAALVRSDEDVEKIHAAMELYAKSGVDGEEQMDRDIEFHRLIVAAAHNHYLDFTFNMLKPHILVAMRLGRQMRTVAFDWRHAERVAKEHAGIFTAIKDNAPDEAEAAVLKHLSAGIERLIGK